MPSAADVQTQNNGGTAGKAESGDSITYTSGRRDPRPVLSGWDGSTTNVTAHFDTYISKDDVLYFRDASTGPTLVPARPRRLELGGDYSNNATSPIRR